MSQIKIAYNLLIVFCVFVFLIPKNGNAQIVIGTPNLGFSQACASDSFNTYNATFIFSPEAALDASNQFIIELSDADGDFTNATELYASTPGSITESPATLNFSFPTETAGENYRIRIKSTAPTATSAGSTSFAAYYKIQDSPFTINNLVSSGAFCIGGSYLLTIDNPGSGTNDSPLNYPSLTFNWFKETGPTTSEFVAQGDFLEVTEDGTYFAETNYGTCTSGSFSNRVTITQVASGDAEAGVSSSLGNPFCPDNGATTLSTITATSYQWFKDGEAIDGATEQMFEAMESGTYAVQVDLGNCSAFGTIELESEAFDVSISVDEMNVLAEGESLSVSVSSTALNPTYEWYLNDGLIAEAISDTYEATLEGSYTIIITETNGCEASRELNFMIEEEVNPFPEVENIPNIVSPNGDGFNDTWIIPTKYVSGTDTEVMIMTNRGKVVLQTDNYLNNWPENDLELTSINQVFYYVISTSDGDTKKGSITVVR